MDKSLYSKARIEDAGEICRKIIEDASAQAGSILTRAGKEKSKILEEANQEAENKKKEALKKNDIEVEKMRQKIFSTLNLEKKKLFLEEKSRFIETVLEKVREIAAEFRKDQGYKAFLEKAISEGVEVIGERDVDVLYSALDEKIIKGDFIKNINGVTLEFKKCDFKDIGVIVQSKDSRLIYDNTFSARFKRLHDDIYMDLLKGVF
ncbi:MAG: V-type ATP synthase subunit E family protein [Candidatus Omnitrophica bacterium]|nr:V-type ATP synthase subunit E family protein [Candidatus Omnitrophota bacterium]